MDKRAEYNEKEMKELLSFLKEDFSSIKDNLKVNSLIYAITCDCIHKFSPSK